MENTPDIGERIKKVRNESKMSMAKFGTVIGISAPSVFRIESGENSPSQQTIKMICQAFNISEEWLRTGSGEMKLALSKEEEIAQIVKAMYTDYKTTGNRTQLISYLNEMIKYVAKLDEKQLDVLTGIINGYIDELNAKK